MKRLIPACILTLIAASASAQTATPERVTDTPSGQPVPRFVSLKFDVANGRSGPSQDHPIAWRYTRSGLPMQVVAETEEWRRVTDPDGETTWMHRSILSGRRSAYTLEETVLRARAEEDAPIEAVAEAGIVLFLERCRTGWCRVEAQGYRGWVETGTLWGLYPEEQGDNGNGSAALSGSLPRDTALR